MGVNRSIDINCDLGEGMLNDEALMAHISSCNIACGGHFGTKETIRKTIQLAKLHKVKVGAHPSYPDRENFGRKSLNISSPELVATIKEQLLSFFSVCLEEGIEPNHIKLHGALYNDCARNESIAEIIQTVYEDLNVSVPMYAPPNSAVIGKISRIESEAFIDRRYNDDGSLVSRTLSKALIEDPVQAWEQLSRMYFDQEVMCLHKHVIPLNASTFCLHGDTKNALQIARFISSKLKLSNISLNKNE